MANNTKTKAIVFFFVARFGDPPLIWEIKHISNPDHDGIGLPLA